MSKNKLIFISYRRKNTADVTGRIYDRLAEAFGRDAIFKDVNNTPVGLDYREYLEFEINQCQILLVVIGNDWINAIDADGKRRLDNPADLVRIEIELALKRGIRVIPVLIGNALMPEVSQLPESIADLAGLSAARVGRDPDFHIHMDRLIDDINSIINQTVDNFRFSTEIDNLRPETKINTLEWIKLILSEPSPLFFSYAYFIFRIAKQLGLINNKEDSFKLLEDIFIKAVTTVTLIEQFNRFFNKSHFMNNPMVFIKWVSYSILLNRATIRDGMGEKIDDFDPMKVKKIQYGIWIINQAAGMLEDEITEDFYILMLRYQQGCNWDMIQRLFEEQGKKYDKITLIRKSKHTLNCFRKVFQEEFGKFDENFVFPQIHPDKKDFVVTYYKLGLKPYLNKEIVPFGNENSYGKAEDINVIYNLILRSNQNSWLNYWFSEIDHVLSHVNDINESLPRERLNQLIEQLNSKIDNHIELLQNTLKIKLKSFGKDSKKQAFSQDGKTQEFHDFSAPKYYKLVDEFHDILRQEIGYELKYEHWNQNSNGHGFVPINCLKKENIEKYDQVSKIKL